MFAQTFLLALAATVPALAALDVPHLNVPACPNQGTVTYSKSVPNRTEFPPSEVNVCYDDSAIHITFTAYNEVNYYYNASQGTNDAIWEYEVMETFIYHGTNDPQTYLEFEVNPINVTFQAFIYNPSKVRAPNTPFDTFFITEPLVDGLNATSSLDKAAHTWTSAVRIPLGLFNVDDGTAQGTQWRMNFFRTITSPSLYPNQILGAWSPTNQSNFHMTPFFGNVHFV